MSGRVVETRGSNTAALGRVTHEHDVLTALGDHESEPLIERLRFLDWCVGREGSLHDRPLLLVR